MGMRVNYWSCSRFAHWITATFCGAPKLSAGTSEEWQDWNHNAQTGNKFAYWVAEELLDDIQDVVYWPHDKLCAIRYYINNRFITKTHVLKTKLKPGDWHEFETRLLHGMFEEFIDFVEIEQAWHHVCWDDQARAKFKLPWWKRVPYPFRIKVWRCPEAGLAHLDWESVLVNDDEWGYSRDSEQYGKPTHQAITAIEELRLYNWWKTIRPNRVDPYDASGWTEICDRKRERGLGFLSNDRTPEDVAETRAALDLCTQLEAQYHEEDTDMMVALIKLRTSLWT